MRSARMRLAGAALVPFLLLATGCKFGSDDKNDDDRPAGNAASVAPTGGSPAPASPAGSSAPAAPGKALTSDQLKAALATAKELGTGWTVRPNVSVSYGSIPMKAVPANAACQPLLDLFTGSSPQSAAYAGEILNSSAAKQDTSTVDLVRYEGDALTKAFDAALKAAQGDCLEFAALNTKNQKTVYHLSYVDDQPKNLGDQVMWLDISWGDEKTMADPNAPSLNTRLQFVRMGSVLVKYDTRPAEVCCADFVPEAQVRVQVDKLAAALKG